MAGYLDAYGVADARKERIIKRVVLISLAVAIVGASAYFIFRNWRQEQVIKSFFELLRDKEYQPAYALWGCTQDRPCKYYGPERFTADWGPGSPYGNVASIKIAHEDTCGSGVVFNIEQPNTQSIGLYVDRDSNQISFAPEPRCPGRHLQIWEFLKSKFE